NLYLLGIYKRGRNGLLAALPATDDRRPTTDDRRPATGHPGPRSPARPAPTKTKAGHRWADGRRLAGRQARPKPDTGNTRTSTHRVTSHRTAVAGKTGSYNSGVRVFGPADDRGGVKRCPSPG